MVREFRQSPFEAMFRFPLPLALAQLPAIRELAGVPLKGPTWAERHAAAVLEKEEARLLAQYRAARAT